MKTIRIQKIDGTGGGQFKTLATAKNLKDAKKLAQKEIKRLGYSKVDGTKDGDFPHIAIETEEDHLVLHNYKWINIDDLEEILLSEEQ